MPSSSQVEQRIRQLWRSRTFWKAAGLIFAVVMVLLSSQLLPWRQWLQAFTEWSGDRGFTGMLLFGAAYVVATVLCLWGAVFTIGAGVGFGPWWGMLVAWLGATIGSALAFLIARYLARAVIERWAQGSAQFSAIDHTIGRHGWKIVLLLRLNPIIPFSLSNYAFGLTRVRFWPYLVASVIGIIPGTALYTYLGHIGKETLTGAGTDGSGASWLHYAALFGGVILLAGGTAYVGRLAKRALPAEAAEALESKDPATPSA